MVDLFPEYNHYFERQVSSAWQRFRHLVPDSVERWCEVNYEVRHGNAKEEILKVAEEKNADLIIIGARGAGMSVGPWGSVSSAVVRGADSRYWSYGRRVERPFGLPDGQKTRRPIPRLRSLSGRRRAERCRENIQR